MIPSPGPTRVTRFGELKRHQEEVAAYDRALALDPNYANAWNNKATALRGLGRTDEAERRAKELGG
jgi:tetratricopeptide (TPR) repeat protein